MHQPLKFDLTFAFRGTFPCMMLNERQKNAEINAKHIVVARQQQGYIDVLLLKTHRTKKTCEKPSFKSQKKDKKFGGRLKCLFETCQDMSNCLIPPQLITFQKNQRQSTIKPISQSLDCKFFKPNVGHFCGLNRNNQHTWLR